MRDIEAVGLVGVGTVGRLFADALVAHDYSLTAYDVDESRARYVEGRGGRVAASLAAVAAAADAVVLSLPSLAALEDVMDGPDGLLAHLEAGRYVVHTGTMRPDVEVRYWERCRERGVGYLDGPVTRIEGGQGGSVAMMVGGERADYEACSDLLSAMTSAHTLVGPAGKGQVLKLAKQIVGAGYDAAEAEAIEFARELGVEPELLNDVLDMGIDPEFFGSTFEGSESGVGQLRLRRKDLRFALDAADPNDVAVPLTNLTHEAHKAATLRGDGTWLHEGVVTYWRVLNGENESFQDTPDSSA
jgi:2-hydroxy-3-oxopropionate reductase